MLKYRRVLSKNEGDVLGPVPTSAEQLQTGLPDRFLRTHSDEPFLK